MKDSWEVFIDTGSLGELYEPDDDDDNDDFDEDKVAVYEIGAIRKDDEHGHKSWGWGDADNKIILFGNSTNPLTGEDIVSDERIEWAKKVAQGLCDVLNKMEE